MFRRWSTKLSRTDERIQIREGLIDSCRECDFRSLSGDLLLIIFKDIRLQRLHPKVPGDPFRYPRVLRVVGELWFTFYKLLQKHPISDKKSKSKNLKVVIYILRLYIFHNESLGRGRKTSVILWWKGFIKVVDIRGHHWRFCSFFKSVMCLGSFVDKWWTSCLFTETRNINLIQESFGL